MRRALLLPLIPFALAACGADQTSGPSAASSATTADFASGSVGGAGAVYVLSNAAAGNAVLAFARSGDGSLAAPVSVPTGGLGTGAGLGNQGAIARSNNGHFLYAVNAGSDELSAFRVTSRGLERIGNVSSGGDLPISIALHDDLLYVVNDGVSPNVTGFRVGADGGLTAIAGSSRPLSSSAPDAAQVGISPDGTRLVVTEKAANLIVGWDITPAGTLTHRTLSPSAGEEPFGFRFDDRGTLLIAETFNGAPNASTASSYRATSTGWSAISALVATTETAACWAAVTPNGRFMYTANTGSNTVTGFAVGHDGSLTLLDADGVTGSTAATPTDADITRNGQYLYVRDSAARAISSFRIAADGSLQHLGETAGLPAGSNGLSAE